MVIPNLSFKRIVWKPESIKLNIYILKHGVNNNNE